MTNVWTSSSVAPVEDTRLRASAPISSNAATMPLALVGGQDAHALQRPRERLRAADIGIDQPPVEMQRSGEALEDFRRSASNRPPQSFIARLLLPSAPPAP